MLCDASSQNTGFFRKHDSFAMWQAIAAWLPKKTASSTTGLLALLSFVSFVRGIYNQPFEMSRGKRGWLRSQSIDPEESSCPHPAAVPRFAAVARAKKKLLSSASALRPRPPQPTKNASPANSTASNWFPPATRWSKPSVWAGAPARDAGSTAKYRAVGNARAHQLRETRLSLTLRHDCRCWSGYARIRPAAT